MRERLVLEGVIEQNWKRSKWERERNSGWRSFRSEISERRVIENAVEVVREVVVSNLWLNHLQVWFSSLSTLFSSSTSSPKCICSCSFIVEVCCWSVLEDILLVHSSFSFSLSLSMEHKKFWV